MFCIGSITLTIPFVKSKKERRALLNHIIDKLKRQNVSVQNNSSEYPHEGLVLFAFVSEREESVKKSIEKMEEIIFEVISDEYFEIEYEII